MTILKSSDIRPFEGKLFKSIRTKNYFLSIFYNFETKDLEIGQKVSFKRSLSENNCIGFPKAYLGN